jgi:hypothetical protein
MSVGRATDQAIAKIKDLKPSDGLEPSTPSLPWRFSLRGREG